MEWITPIGFRVINKYNVPQVKASAVKLGQELSRYPLGLIPKITMEDKANCYSS